MLKRIKRAVKEINRKQNGQVLIMVLIVLALGAIVLAPTLNHAATSIKHQQLIETDALELYAADAGVEDALWKLKYAGPLSKDYSYSLGEQVNGMNVELKILDAEQIAEDSIRYVIKSTAKLDGETMGEVVARVLAQYSGGVAAGGEGGDFKTRECLGALSTIDDDTVIFTTLSGAMAFTGWNSDDESIQLKTNDLYSLNMTTGFSAAYLDGPLYGLGDQVTFGGVHYYEYGGYECLLISLASPEKPSVGTNDPPCDCDNDDIIRLHLLGTGDPESGHAELVYDMRQYFDKSIDIAAVGRLENGHVLFSLSNKGAELKSDYGGDTFEPYQIIEFEPPSSPSFSLYLDTSIILNAERNITALTPLPDGRLLLSFNQDVKGNNGNEIQTGDIAIWTPAAWTSGGPNEPGTINLHIDMNGGEGGLQPIPPNLNIEAWKIK